MGIPFINRKPRENVLLLHEIGSCGRKQMLSEDQKREERQKDRKTTNSVIKNIRKRTQVYLVQDCKLNKPKKNFEVQSGPKSCFGPSSNMCSKMKKRAEQTLNFQVSAII